MVDLQRGVQSYLIAKSSESKLGTSRHRTPAGARLSVRGPCGAPAASLRAQKNLQVWKKFKRGEEKFFASRNGVVNPPLSGRAVS